MAAARAPAVPDAPALHKELLDLHSTAEDIVRTVERLLERVEDVLDAQESRETLKHGRVPWSEVKAGLELS